MTYYYNDKLRAKQKDSIKPLHLSKIIKHHLDKTKKRRERKKEKRKRKERSMFT